MLYSLKGGIQMLSNQQLKILKYIRKYRTQGKILSKLQQDTDDYQWLNNQFDKPIDYFLYNDNLMNRNTVITLSRLSENLLNFEKSANFKFWIPTIISMLALLVSILNLFSH